MPSQPSYKYLYERLGDKRFQNLCAALVVAQWPGVQVFPVGQSDAGRDITAHNGDVVIQVKFTVDPKRNPVSWLKAAMKGEEDNIRALVEEGCSRYILMTNVQGSAAPAGDIDQINDALKQYEKTFGINMVAMWCVDIDAWVDNAGPDLRLAYVDMLAGADALIALLQSTQLQDNERRERELLVDYVSTHWDRDKKVKFTQVELKSNLLIDLFVDVPGARTRSPARASLTAKELGGLAHYLLSPEIPYALVEGVPGQGKSTLAQYISQVYRADFLNIGGLEVRDEPTPADEAPSTRLPIRIDLAEFALWASGENPWATEVTTKAKKPRTKTDIETFLVAHFEATTSGFNVKKKDIDSILQRFSTQVTFDGLDEVANPKARDLVVKEIDEFLSRQTLGRAREMRILVTTRPNSSNLAEPSSERFERVLLKPLTDTLRKRYLRLWAKAQELDSPQTRALEKIFGERTAAPHVSQLANNPMQLTILLHLINTKGESLPSDRTALYAQYMSMFLDREASKSPLVLRNRPDIEEATAYLGWYIQGCAEIDATASKLPEKRIVDTMTRYLAGVGRKDTSVKEVFDAMHERVWVLTSKDTGTFEFDVQPIREFFTAQFLHEYASYGDGSSFDAADALRRMLAQPYWANTARFLAGHFQKNRLSDVADALLDELSKTSGLRQANSTTWSLLSDGAFARRTPAQERIAEHFAGDLALRLLVADGSNVEISDLQAAFGGEKLASSLRALIAAAPGDAMSFRRALVASKVGALDFTQWWSEHLSIAAGTGAERDWLRIGATLADGSAIADGVVDRLHLATPQAAVDAVRCGIEPAPSSPQEFALLEAVLDGHASDIVPFGGTSEAADLLRAVGPPIFIDLTDEYGTLPNNSERTRALERLKNRHANFGRVQHAMRVGKGQSGTTSRWVNTARELAAIYGGPQWIATEIAAIGAALPPTSVVTGGDKTAGAPAFGADMDYGQWLPSIRANRSKAAWWEDQRSNCTDSHSLAAWVLGLLAVADADTLESLLVRVDEAVEELPADRVRALLSTSGRIGGNRAHSLDIASASIKPVTRLLLAHHARDKLGTIGKDPANLHAFVDIPYSWPAFLAATQIALSNPSHDNLALVAAFGPRHQETTFRGVLPRQAAMYVLQRPSQFSDAWILLADESLAIGESVTPLRSYAEATWGIN